MTRQLTLNLDEELIDRTESFASRSGKSVSQVISDLLERSLRTPETGRTEDGNGRSERPHGSEDPELDTLTLPPLVRSLVGILKGTGADETDYDRYLEEKYR